MKTLYFRRKLKVFRKMSPGVSHIVYLVHYSVLLCDIFLNYSQATVRNFSKPWYYDTVEEFFFQFFLFSLLGKILYVSNNWIYYTKRRWEWKEKCILDFLFTIYSKWSLLLGKTSKLLMNLCGELLVAHGTIPSSSEPKTQARCCA